METLEKLEKQIDEIDQNVIDRMGSDEDLQPFTDGIINPKKYLESKYKILWILKEPYDGIDDDGIPRSGGGTLAKDLNKDKFYKDMIKDKRGYYKTYAPMIYVSYSLLNGFMKYDNMDDIENNISMTEIFKSTALINVKK